MRLPEVSDVFKRVEVKKSDYVRTMSAYKEEIGPHGVRLPKGAIPDYVKLTPFQDFSWRVMGRYATEKAAGNQLLEENLMKAHMKIRAEEYYASIIMGTVIAAVIGGLLGAKIHYLILHPDAWPENMLSGEGLVWFGGLFGAIAAVAVVTLVSKQRVAAIMDSGAIGVSVGYGVGRIGCFLRGCDYGQPTDLPWGMSFPKGVPPTPEGVLVHPTQLYEIAATLVIFVLLTWVIAPRLKREGPLMFAYAVLAGIEKESKTVPVWRAAPAATPTAIQKMVTVPNGTYLSGSRSICFGYA